MTGHGATPLSQKNQCLASKRKAVESPEMGNMTMAGQLAVITGASSGIGYNLAKVFAENGFDLVIASAGERLDKAEVDFQSMGVQVKAVHADLATYDGVKSLWQEVEALNRPVDAICLNAGVGSGGLFVDTDLDAEINLVRLNLTSREICCKAHGCQGLGKNFDHGLDRERDGRSS